MSTSYRVLSCLFIASFLAAPAAFGQDAQTFSQEWLTAKTSSPLMKSVQANAVYRPSVRMSQYMSENIWIDESRTLSEYSAGRLISRVMENSYGETWEPTEMHEFSYAFDGTLANETVYEWDGAAWAPLGRTLYDSQNGLFTQILNQSPAQGGGWNDVERTVFTVENDLITGGQTDIWLGSWIPNERFILDQQPNRVHEITQMPDGTGWMNVSRTTYPQVTIAELYEILTQLVIALDDYEGMYFTLQLPDATVQDWNGAEWVNVSNQTTERFYELFTGKLMKNVITTRDWDGGVWVESFRMTVDYSMEAGLEGVPTLSTMQVFDGSDWQDLFVETYEHQANIGRIVQATLSADLGTGPEDVSRTTVQWIDAMGTGVEKPEAPVTFVLEQNVPNPFNPSTRIGYTLTEGQAIQLAVYDMLGRRVEVLESGFRSVGEYAVTWDASAMPSGMYLYRLETAAGVQTKTMVLLK